MSIFKTDYLEFGENLYEIVPPAPTEVDRGGIIASPKTDADTIEARLGDDGKLYVENIETDLSNYYDKTEIDEIAVGKAEKEHVHESYETKDDATAKYDELVEVKANKEHEHSWNDLNDRPFYEESTVVIEELTFDGDITGKKTIDLGGGTHYVKVSDTPISEEDVKKLIGKTFTYHYGGDDLEKEIYSDSIYEAKYNNGVDYCDITSGNIVSIYIFREDFINEETGVHYEVGVYFYYNTSYSNGVDSGVIANYVSKLDGISNTTLVQIDEKFIPDTIAKVSDLENIDIPDVSIYETKEDAQLKYDTFVEVKADTDHTHTITATATGDDVIVLTGTNGSNEVTFDAKHANSGVTAGIYKSVTVNAKGHVTSGTNPTTLSGYGITDAYTKTQIDSTVTNLNTAINGKANATHSHAISDVTNLRTELDTKINTSDADAKYVQYKSNSSVSVGGTTKPTYRFLPPDTDGVVGTSSGAAYFPEGIVMGGSAASAGLMARGICGISTPDASTGSCDKDNLYINYDGVNDYNDSRQLVLQAGTAGTHYGNNLYQYAAARGDAVKGYCDATYVNVSGDTMTGTLTNNAKVSAAQGFIVPQSDGTTGYGVSLYGSATPQTYGLWFGQTKTFGTHGSVAGDWATYFGMNSGATNRGWVFRREDGCVASISGAGNLTLNGTAKIGNAVTLQYDSTNECLNFVFG